MRSRPKNTEARCSSDRPEKSLQRFTPLIHVIRGFPGQGENIVLWGHALRFHNAPDIPAPFGRLSQLKLGANIVLFDSNGTPYTYTVTHQLWVTPDQVSYILPTGKERVTMVPCIGDQIIGDDGTVVGMTHRLITIAEPKA